MLDDAKKCAVYRMEHRFCPVCREEVSYGLSSYVPMFGATVISASSMSASEYDNIAAELKTEGYVDNIPVSCKCGLGKSIDKVRCLTDVEPDTTVGSESICDGLADYLSVRHIE